ncbi:NUDIX hydrolase [Acidianus brierleyi]|uniref:NUDIX hydrolase n=1 Tax=Acidianus brierleyi TaxID=41673 RepID=A0A2U9IBU0_9CREN|nr:NUDIX hydrolase [Acidianus brierleyi]AWR93481.1 NUDIX domain-containing protein [Acidianus brierleyi]
MKVFSCKKFEVNVDKITLPNGKEKELQYIKHRGSAVMIPVIDRENIVLIKQYRPVIGKWIYEFPAGTIEENEEPEVTARRELIEEVGYEAGELIHLFDFYPSPGITTELMHMYLAKNLKFVGSKPEEYEIIESEKMSLDNAINMFLQGQIEDGKTIIGILYLARNRDLIQ